MRPSGTRQAVSFAVCISRYLLPFFYIQPILELNLFRASPPFSAYIFTPASRQGAAPQKLSRVAAFGCLQLANERGTEVSSELFDDAGLFVAHATVFDAIELYRNIPRFHDNQLNHGHDVVLFSTLEVAPLSPGSQMAFSPRPGCKLSPSEIFPSCSKMFARRCTILSH